MLQRIFWSDDEPPPGPTYVFPDRPAAWDFLRHILDVIFSLFGDPARLMKLGGVSKCFRVDMNDWLGPAERLARILLLAEAAEIKLPKPRKKRAPLHRLLQARWRRRTDLSKPNSADWRVGFQALRGSTRCGSGAKGYSIPSTNPRRLAERFEALARVALDPSPHARRLAFSLRRRADRRRQVAAILRAPKLTAGSLFRACTWALPLAAVSLHAFDTG